MTHQIIKNVTEDYTLRERIVEGSEVFDYELLFPPDSEGSTKDGSFWKLERIGAVLNSEPGVGDDTQPSSNVATSLRFYWLPYTKRVCELHGESVGQRTFAKYRELVRTTPRIAVAGWYPGDTGQRELMDTNFGKGHWVPVQKAGDFWVLLMAYKNPSAVTEQFSITLDWAMHAGEALRWRN